MTFTYDPANYEATLLAAAGSNFHSAAASPSATSDSAHGYSIGSRWLNTSTGAMFVCTDATATAAVWVQLVASVSSGNVILSGLPSSDPHVVGALYTSTGAVKVSAG
jgi:hypothetical protein